MMAGHEMRRVREMFPSFDTRRVLCKQQRNHCVKPMRAGRKARNANIAVQYFCRQFGQSRLIAQIATLITSATRPQLSKDQGLIMAQTKLLCAYRSANTGSEKQIKLSNTNVNSAQCLMFA
jgi:hypothetical protein